MTPKEQKRQGYRNQEGGAAFEKQLREKFAILSEMGMMHISKVPEPLRVVSGAEKGVFKAIYIRAAAQVDYQGTLAGGRAVLLEAKYTRSDKMEFDRVAERQAAVLTAHDRLGACCGVVVCFSFAAYGVVPWSAWLKMKEILGRKYIKADDLTEHGWAFTMYPASDLAARLQSLVLTRY